MGQTRGSGSVLSPQLSGDLRPPHTPPSDWGQVSALLLPTKLLSVWGFPHFPTGNAPLGLPCGGSPGYGFRYPLGTASTSSRCPQIGGSLAWSPVQGASCHTCLLYSQAGILGNCLRVGFSPPQPLSHPRLLLPASPRPASSPPPRTPRLFWLATLPPPPGKAVPPLASTQSLKPPRENPPRPLVPPRPPYLWSQRDGEGASLRSPPGSWSCSPALAEARGTRPAPG